MESDESVIHNLLHISIEPHATNGHSKATNPLLSPALSNSPSTPSTIKSLLQDEHFALFYDLTAFQSLLDTVKSSFPSHFRHCLAMKANPLRGLLKLSVERGFGLEVASYPELLQAVSLLPNSERSIVFDSPAKTREELKEALRLGVTINIDNLEELERVANLVALTPTKSPIGIRVNPQVGAGSITITSTATSTSKFGVGLSDNRALLVDLYLKYPFLSGIHEHVGSQGCTIDLLVQGAHAIVELVHEINALRKQKGIAALKYIDIGGGLSVDYGFDSATSEPRKSCATLLPAFKEYASKLAQGVPYLFETKDLLVFTEFGRSISAKCGFVVSEVEYVKETGGRKMAVIHCGADMFVRPAYLPQLWKHRLTLLDRHGHLKSTINNNSETSNGSKDPELHPWDIVGPLCFSGDIIAHQRLLPEIISGDHIVIHDAGAYTLAMWSRYNSRQSPSVIGLQRDENGAWHGKYLRARETVEDVLRFWG